MKKLTKKAVSTGMITKMIAALVGVVVLFLLLAELIPEAQTAGDTLNSAGVPLGTLFASDGVIFIIIMAAVLLAIIGIFLVRKYGK